MFVILLIPNKLIDYMAKLYTERFFKEKLDPKTETISFLLNYSKSIKVVNTKKENLMFHLN